ncbi:dephospho-CoA kinase/protein folding accessory domain-containing protein [Devosia sp. LC5]|uniref:GrpB family protein n=1 Tax=Devosia sp. LC5 TaxID=1502724 RepID=UPI0004E44797|nr:GrpB family protein [Devosia sp. LC5]KFC64418.1 dephospho-CoA kinase/protein folding accessory domain-containing protein [Devosia sp. LC5]
MSEAVELVPYSDDWPRAFNAIAPTIAACFDPPPLRLDHIGSSAVPGLPAKPILDIIVLVADMEKMDPALVALERAGFEFRPEVSNAHRMFLRKLGPAGHRTHHLHIHDSADEVRRHVMFRDCLRNDATTRAAYLAHKEDLATRFREDRGAYSRGKSDFIDEVIRAAGGPERVPWNP